MGLVKPQRIGRKNRLYSDADIERLRQIQRLTHDLGVNLAGVEVIFDLLKKIEEMQNQMDEEIARIREETENRLKELHG